VILVSVDPSNSQYINTIIASLSGLAGTILGWVLNNLSSRGKLSFYVLKWENIFYGGSSPLGGPLPVTDFSEAQMYSYIATMDVYNRSSFNKVIRDVAVCFYRNNKFILSHEPNNKEARKVTDRGIYNEEFRYENIPPKEVRRLSLSGTIHEQDFQALKGLSYVKITYSSENGRKKNIKIPPNNFDVFR
jgi:hypothetical protein